MKPQFVSYFILTAIFASGCINTKTKAEKPTQSETFKTLEYSSCTNIEIVLPKQYSNWVVFYGLDDGEQFRSSIGRSGVLLAPRNKYDHLAIMYFRENHGLMNGRKLGRSGFCVAIQEEMDVRVLKEIEPMKLHILRDGSLESILTFSSDSRSNWKQEIIKVLDDVR